MAKKKAASRKARKGTTRRKAVKAVSRLPKVASRPAAARQARGAAAQTAQVSQAWRTDTSVAAILAECEAEVLKGLRAERLEAPATVGLHPSAKTAFEDFFGPKIKARHDKSGTPGNADWNGTNATTGKPEKEKPLLVANHLGRICGILSAGPIVTSKIAKVAAAAVQKDENCRGAAGTGDWCA